MNTAPQVLYNAVIHYLMGARKMGWSDKHVRGGREVWGGWAKERGGDCKAAWTSPSSWNLVHMARE